MPTGWPAGVLRRAAHTVEVAYDGAIPWERLAVRPVAAPTPAEAKAAGRRVH